MRLSDGEKLALLMLSEIYDKIGVKGEIEPDFIRSAIFSDNLWGIAWKYPGILFERAETPKVVSDVVDILDMWSFIEESYERLSEPDKKKVEKEAEPFGRNPKFRGFDGNNEAKYISVASFLIDDLDQFQRFKGRGLNAHMPTIDGHARMVRALEPMRPSLASSLLTADQIVELLFEQVHPDNR